MGTDAGSRGPCGVSCAECPACRSSELCRPGLSETSSGPLAGGRVCVAQDSRQQLCQSLRPGLGKWGMAFLHGGPSVPQVPRFWGPSRTECSHCALCVLLLTLWTGLLTAPALDCKEIHPVHPKGDQSWVFIGKTDVEAETNTLAT